MAGRPTKQGLDFFLLDVDFFRNMKIRKIAKACGPNAYAVIICLLCNIYRDKGYYILWDEDLPFVIADELGISEGCVKEIITRAIQVDFFSQEKFSEHKVLTSGGIQKRYFNAAYKRKEVDRREGYIINSSEMAINDGNNSINDSHNQHSNSNSNSNNISISVSNEERERIFEIFFFKNARNPEAEVDKFVNHYQGVGWIRKGERITDRVAVAQNWDIREGGRFPATFLTMWHELYQQLGRIEAARPELGRMLTEIHAVEVKDLNVTFKLSNRLYKYLERSVEVFKPVWQKHYPGYRLNYLPQI